MGLFSKKPKMLTYNSSRGPIKYMEYISDEYLPEDPSLLQNMALVYTLRMGRGKDAPPKKHCYHVAIKHFTVVKHPDDPFWIEEKLKLGFELLERTNKHGTDPEAKNVYRGSDSYFFEDYTESQKIEMGMRFCREALEASLLQPELFGETVNAYLMCNLHTQLGIGLGDMFDVLSKNLHGTNPERSKMSRNIYDFFHSDMDVFYKRVMRHSDGDREDLPQYLPELLRAAKISLKEYFEIAKSGINNAHLLSCFCQDLTPADVKRPYLSGGHTFDLLSKSYRDKYGNLGYRHARALAERGAKAGLLMYAQLNNAVADWD